MSFKAGYCISIHYDGTSWCNVIWQLWSNKPDVMPVYINIYIYIYIYIWNHNCHSPYPICLRGSCKCISHDRKFMPWSIQNSYKNMITICSCSATSRTMPKYLIIATKVWVSSISHPEKNACRVVVMEFRCICRRLMLQSAYGRSWYGYCCNTYGR